MLEVKFILLIIVFLVPHAQKCQFFYVNGLLYASFIKAKIFVKCTIIYIIQLLVSTLLQIIFARIFFVILPFL